MLACHCLRLTQTAPFPVSVRFLSFEATLDIADNQEQKCDCDTRYRCLTLAVPNRQLYGCSFAACMLARPVPTPWYPSASRQASTRPVGE